MPLKCSNCYKILFDHLRLSFNAFNKVFLYKICVKYQYDCQGVFAYADAFPKQPGCALIGACALIRMNTVCYMMAGSAALCCMK